MALWFKRLSCRYVVLSSTPLRGTLGKCPLIKPWPTNALRVNFIGSICVEDRQLAESCLIQQIVLGASQVAPDILKFAGKFK